LENRDLGLLSQYELYVRSEKDSPLEMGADPTRNPIQQLFVAANVTKLSQLLDLLKAKDCAVRRWGAIGLLALSDNAAPAMEALLAALKDSSPDVRMTAAEALCGLGRADDAMPVLIELLSHESRIIRNETLLAICRIGPAAKPALPHLDKALPSCQHTGIWSHDNIAELIALARACIVGDPSDKLRLTRQKYLP